MLLLPPVKVGGGTPPGRYYASRREGWCYRGTIVVLACYRTDAEMTRQERSLSALSMPGAKQQRGRRLTVCPEGGLGAEILLDRAIYASRRGVPLKKRNFVRVLSNFRGPAGSSLATIHYLRFFIFHFSFFNIHYSFINAPSRFLRDILLRRPSYPPENCTPPQQCSRRGKP